MIIQKNQIVVWIGIDKILAKGIVQFAHSRVETRRLIQRFWYGKTEGKICDRRQCRLITIFIF